MAAPIVKPPHGIATYTVPQGKYLALRDVNPCRFWISAPSNPGKTVLVLSWLLDVMRGKYHKVILLSPSSDLDSSWASLKESCKTQLGQDPRKEPLYFSDWSDQRVLDQIEEQTKFITEQRHRKETKNAILHLGHR